MLFDEIKIDLPNNRNIHAIIFETERTFGSRKLEIVQHNTISFRPVATKFPSMYILRQHETIQQQGFHLSYLLSPPSGVSCLSNCTQLPQRLLSCVKLLPAVLGVRNQRCLETFVWHKKRIRIFSVVISTLSYEKDQNTITLEKQKNM